MSPSFMNQRKISDNEKIIPHVTAVTPSEEPESLAEDIVFDKAEQAEQLEKEKLQMIQEIESLEAALKQVSSEKEEKVKQEKLEKMQERLKALEERPKLSEFENGKGLTAGPKT